MNSVKIIINSKSKNDFNLYEKTQKKISSKLKIIKTVKNKILYNLKKIIIIIFLILIQQVKQIKILIVIVKVIEV